MSLEVRHGPSFQDTCFLLLHVPQRPERLHDSPIHRRRYATQSSHSVATPCRSENNERSTREEEDENSWNMKGADEALGGGSTCMPQTINGVGACFGQVQERVVRA